MKKMAIVMIGLLLIFTIFNFTYVSNAAVGIDELGNPDNYTKATDDNRGVVNIANVIVWAVRTVGEMISVIMLIIIGIRYVLGSVEEKAEYKQSMWPYILGAVLIFAGAEVTNIIYKAFT